MPLKDIAGAAVAELVPALMAGAVHRAADLDTAGGVAAVQLIVEYNDSSLLARPDLRKFINEIEPGVAEVQWGRLLAALGEGPSPTYSLELTISGTPHAIVLLACALATSGPVRDLAGILAKFDQHTASTVLRAFWTALHHGVAPEPGWPSPWAPLDEDTPLFRETRQQHLGVPVP